MAKKAKFESVLGTAIKQRNDSEAAIKQKITIKEELKNFIPPLSEEEFAQLEDNILTEGCRDALILWKQGKEYILVDGHNRFRICSHHKLDFKFELISFKDLEEVKEWMIANQLGKRNIPVNVKTYLRGQRYKLEKKDKTANLKQNESSSQNVQSGSTAKKLAKEYKVSEKTIQRDYLYTQSIDKLAANDNTLKWKILNKDLNVPKNVIEGLLDKTDKDIKQFKDLLIKGKLEDAINSLETDAVPKQKRVTTPPTKIDEFRAEIVKTLKYATQKKDKEALTKLRAMIDELEKMIFT